MPRTMSRHLLGIVLVVALLAPVGCMQSDEQKVSSTVDGFMKALLEGKLRDAQKYVVRSQRSNRPEENINLDEASTVFGVFSELCGVPNFLEMGQSLLKIIQYDGVQSVRFEDDGSATAIATISIFGQPTSLTFHLRKEQGDWLIFDLE